MEMVHSPSSQGWDPDVTGEGQAVCSPLPSAILSGVRGQGCWTVSCLLGCQRSSTMSRKVPTMVWQICWKGVPLDVYILLARKRSPGMEVKLIWKPSLGAGEICQRAGATGSPTCSWWQKTQEEWKNIHSAIPCCFSPWIVPTKQSMAPAVRGEVFPGCRVGQGRVDLELGGNKSMTGSELLWHLSLHTHPLINIWTF